MKNAITVPVMLALLIMTCGCTSPAPSATPIPTATATPAASPTVTPGPTLIGGTDQAFVGFTYNLRSMKQYMGLEASPGNRLYLLDVSVTSDKPVDFSPEWFKIDFWDNETSMKTYSPFTYNFDVVTIIPEKGSVRGWLLYEMPDVQTPGYEPRPVLSPPDAEKQRGPYKIHNKVYGEKGLIA